MKRRLMMVCIACAVAGGMRGYTGVTASPQAQFRTHTDREPAPRYSSRGEWEERARYLREHVLATAGLQPMPQRTPLGALVFGEVTRPDYTVSKVYFESLPGFFVTGNLYRPAGPGPFPAMLSPHGHWTYGRLENTAVNSGPARAIGLARLGFIVFTYDMVGYGDSQQVPHTFGGRREQLWGLSLAGLQLWNGIRALDFLEALPDVRREAIGMTGESGGGSQTFLLAAVDPRVAVAAPVNMISLHMQGGCLCENAPGLRIGTNNVEIAATIAPRPMLMVSATGDWTKETMEVEYPAMRAIYDLAGAADRVQAVRIDAEHNYNRASREAMYAWMDRWLKNGPARPSIEERPFTIEPLQDLLVFHGRALPPNAVTAEQLTNNWIAATRRELDHTPIMQLRSALQHIVGWTPPPPEPPTFQAPKGLTSTKAAAPSGHIAVQERDKTALLTRPDAALEQELTSRGVRIVHVAFSRFDDAAAAKVRHFETYNRTAAAQQVADLVAARRANPGAGIVADGPAALAALLAVAVEGGGRAVLDVGDFDTASDADFLRTLFIPGLRRVGDLQTVSQVAGHTVVLHNAGPRFNVRGLQAQRSRMTPKEIADALVRSAGR